MDDGICPRAGEENSHMEVAARTSVLWRRAGRSRIPGARTRGAASRTGSIGAWKWLSGGIHSDRWLRMRTVDVRSQLIVLLLVIAGTLSAFCLGRRFGTIGYVFGLPIGAAVMLGIL